MRIDILTIFPEIFDFYFKQSLLGKAIKKRVLKIKIHNLRRFAYDKHKTVDDKPFGGGRGMVMKFEPICRALTYIKKIKDNSFQDKKTPRRLTVLFSPRGKIFSQKMAQEWRNYDQLIFVCGRYEAIDERVNVLADNIISIGNYVLMGGELPALVVIEAIGRLLPEVVGNSDLLLKERVLNSGFLEYPQYTRPAIVKCKGRKLKVPKVLLSGNHHEIERWRLKHSKIIK